jgi:CO/xanthine dehydrogenase FAD-binding subunit
MPVLYNLREYHRPDDLEEAARLLRRREIKTVALAGGVGVVGEGSPAVEAVVDLSALGLDFIEQQGSVLRLGAMVRLQTLVEKLGDLAGGLLADTARQVAGANVRNAATLGGLLASGDIHSPLSVALAALKARAQIHGQPDEPLWVDLASDVRIHGLEGQLITAVVIGQIDAIAGAGYEQVARTPADHPIVCAASVAYRSTETSTCIGGLLRDRLITAIGGTKIGQIVPQDMPESAYLSDFLGGAEYRRHVAPILAQRALNSALAKSSMQP